MNSSAACRIMFALLFSQFTCGAFYDPARRALIPQVVPQDQLKMATTMDSWSWSISSAVGSSIGGFVASRLGSSAAYMLDAASYGAAMLFACCLLVCTVAASTNPQLGGAGVSVLQVQPVNLLRACAVCKYVNVSTWQSALISFLSTNKRS